MNAYVSIVLIVVSINFLNTLKYYFEKTKLFKDNPLDSYFQLVKIAIYIIGGIIILSFLLNKSPLYFFSALGAMTVVLLLVFKDTTNKTTVNAPKALKKYNGDLLSRNDRIIIPPIM